MRLPVGIPVPKTVHKDQASAQAVAFGFKPCLELPDVILIEPTVYADERGWFAEWYKESEFTKNGIPNGFVQDNHSFSFKKGTLRGLHYQNPPKAQGKLVHVPQGEALDIVVDIRRGSPTFGKYASNSLSEANRRILWVPPGFAHGVIALTNNTAVVYKVTEEFSRKYDCSIRWNDPHIGIKWPVRAPVLSQKDRDAPLLAAADIGFVYETAKRRAGREL